jgi:spoIIIJ-associated protein
MGKDETSEPAQEFKGKNLEEALGQAEHDLKMPREKFAYEIVTEKTKLFGIKGKEIVIRAWPKKELDAGPVSAFLETIFPYFPLRLSYQIKKKNDTIYLIFDGEDKNLLLRNDGALLLAFQHILNKISGHKVQADCEFYRRKKEKRLKEYAQQVAQQVQETGKDEILDLMNPYERRIVHIAVNQVPGITSESIGEGFLKRIKVFPVKPASP